MSTALPSAQPLRPLLTLDSWTQTDTGGWTLNSPGGRNYGTIDDQMPERLAPVLTPYAQSGNLPANLENDFGDRHWTTWGEYGAMSAIRDRGRQAYGWDINRLGMGGLTNISQQQMDEFDAYETHRTLGQQYNEVLQANGFEPVQMGETAESARARFEQAKNWTQTEKDEKARVEALKTNYLSTGNQQIDQFNAQQIALAQNTDQRNDVADAKGERDRNRKDEIEIRRVEQGNLEAERAWREREGQADREFAIDKLALQQQADAKTYQMEMRRWEQQNRRDSIGALVAGLATLGAGFAL